MVSIEEDQRHFSFYIELLKTLHLKFDQFFMGLADEQGYEMIIQQWIEELYIEGKTMQEAKKILFIKRHHRFLKLK